MQNNFLKSSKKLLTSTILFLALASPVNAQNTQSWEELQSEFGNEEALCVSSEGVATIQGIMCLLANVLSVSLTVIGLAGFILMIVASLQWMLAGDNSQNVENARKTITFAIVGLIVALSSYMIINLLANFTGINLIKEFLIPPSNTGLPGGPSWSDYGKNP